MPRVWAAALLCAHLALGLWAALSNSPTFDEPAVVTAGFLRVKTGETMPTANPPLVHWIYGAALAATGLDAPETPERKARLLYPYAERLFFWSGRDPQSMILATRLPNLLLSTLFAFALWRRLRSLPALGLYALSPTVLAHASLSTNDLSASVAAAWATLCLGEFFEAPNPRKGLETAAAALWSFLSKFSGALFWAVAAALFLARGRARARPALLWIVLPFAAGLGAFLAVEPDLLASFGTRASQVSEGGHPTYLLGSISESGFKLYYAVAILVKSTPAELFVLAAAALALRRRREPLLLGAALLFAAFFLVSSLSQKQTGLRYALAVYPALAIAAASVVPSRWAKPLIAAQALSCLLAAPDFLSYFNFPSGGSSSASRILVDSNLDWGQDLKRLGRWLKDEGEPEVVLSFFGVASPESYGFKPQHLFTKSGIQRRWANSDRPARELLVVSATHLRELYLPRGAMRWLEGRVPEARVGHTLFVYDITRDRAVHRKLAELYRAAGDRPLAERQERRLKAL